MRGHLDWGSVRGRGQFSLLLLHLSLLPAIFSPCSLIISFAPCSISPFLLLPAPFSKFLWSMLSDYIFLAPCFLPYFRTCSLLPWVSRVILPAPWLPLMGVRAHWHVDQPCEPVKSPSRSSRAFSCGMPHRANSAYRRTTMNMAKWLEKKKGSWSRVLKPMRVQACSGNCQDHWARVQTIPSWSWSWLVLHLSVFQVQVSWSNRGESIWLADGVTGPTLRWAQ